MTPSPIPVTLLAARRLEDVKKHNTASDNHENAEVEELGKMFPLISKNTIEDAYFLCNQNITDTIDHLLAKDLADREKEDQSMPRDSTRPLCKHWVSNQCGGARAAACTDRHYYTDTDRSVGQPGSTRSLQQFSSPYREVVVTEEVLVSKEQVDLESGTAEKVWETRNREVVDLTGIAAAADKANGKASDDNQKGENTNVEGKKLKKREKELNEEIVTEEPQPLKVKKKKSKKDKQENDIEAVTVVEDSPDRDCEESAKKKKKSKKSKKKEQVLEDIPLKVEVAKKKKTKKSKKEEVMEVEEVKSVEEDNGCEKEESKSKKTKKGKKEKKTNFSDEEKETVKKNKRKCDSEDKSTCTNDTTLSGNPLIGFQGSNLLPIPGIEELLIDGKLPEELSAKHL